MADKTIEITLTLPLSAIETAVEQAWSTALRQGQYDRETPAPLARIRQQVTQFAMSLDIKGVIAKFANSINLEEIVREEVDELLRKEIRKQAKALKDAGMLFKVEK
jgi:hypothetical protein